MCWVYILHGLQPNMVITNKCMHQLIVSAIAQNGTPLDHGNSGLDRCSVSNCWVGRLGQNIAL